MSVSIRPYHEELVRRFQGERERISRFLPDGVLIHHVGSSSMHIGGKNIVDILVGVEDAEEMAAVRDLLSKHGYIEGHDSHPDRIFMASRSGETGEGDFHIHICPRSEDSYKDMLILRDYLRAHPEEAREYERMKRVFAKEAGYDRKTYKALKSGYVVRLIEKAKKYRGKFEMRMRRS